MKFTEIVRSLIDKKGISINKMLTDLDMGGGTFATWEKRGTVPGGESLQKIAEYFGVTVDYLLGNGQSNDAAAEAESGLSTDDKRWDKEMLTLFHKLNREGKSAAISMVLGIASNPKFISDETEKSTEEAPASQTA